MEQNKQIINQENQNVKVNPIAFASKFASKREVWRFLSCDCSCYLSSYETMTIWHLRDIVANKRTMIKCKEVKVINIP